MKSGSHSPSSYESFETQILTTTIEWSVALVLAGACAAVVVWQNAHLAVLWDLSYTLNNSYRIALGDVPYRDFPFVHPPITFLIQAALIKFTGRVYWHHIAYCAVASGVATLLTWRTMRRLLDELPYGKVIAILLTMPIVPLGIYCVFPHPFYDPDCTFAILVSLLLLMHLDRRPQSITLPLVTGMAIVMPLFIKQNTGLPFLLTALTLLGGLAIWQLFNRAAARAYVIAILASVATLAIALLLIHHFAGLGNYWHWTIQFAAERRTPARAEMLEIYTAKMNLVWLGFIAAGALVVWLTRNRSPSLISPAALLTAVPFVWPAIYLLRDSDASERADRLINVWPVLLIVSLVAAAITIQRRQGIARILPFVIIAAIQGCFMSQQLWGSTYAIWPLFMILFAMTLVAVSWRFNERARSQPGRLHWLILPLTILVTLSLFVAGIFYVRSHERLSYANLDEGELQRARLPRLKGLATRGIWIPSFEELVHYANSTIPPDDGILMLPGEDAFFYATGRRPQFPVLLFDHTVNPYSPEQIRTICRERNITWVIIKQDLQDEEDAIDQEKDQITAALEEDFSQVDEIGNYEIYKRVDPNAKKDSDDDSDDDDEP